MDAWWRRRTKERTNPNTPGPGPLPYPGPITRIGLIINQSDPISAICSRRSPERFSSLEHTVSTCSVECGAEVNVFIHLFIYYIDILGGWHWSELGVAILVLTFQCSGLAGNIVLIGIVGVQSPGVAFPTSSSSSPSLLLHHTLTLFVLPCRKKGEEYEQVKHGLILLNTRIWFHFLHPASSWCCCCCRCKFPFFLLFLLLWFQVFVWVKMRTTTTRRRQQLFPCEQPESCTQTPWQ